MLESVSQCVSYSLGCARTCHLILGWESNRQRIAPLRRQSVACKNWTPLGLLAVTHSFSETNHGNSTPLTQLQRPWEGTPHLDDLGGRCAHAMLVAGDRQHPAEILSELPEIRS